MPYLLLLLALAAALPSPVFVPEQVHISFGETDNSTYVMWATLNQTADPYVEYSEIGSDSTVQTVNASTRIYANTDYLWDASPLIAYVAQLTDLELGQFYQYRVGSSISLSDFFTFRAKRDFSDPSGPPAQVIIFGDWGTGPEMTLTLDKLINETSEVDYDAIIHLGDIAYEMNSANGANGNLFMNNIQPVAAHIPYMAVQGNHEGPEHSCVGQWLNRFAFPNNSTNFYYSIDLGLIHFAFISTELAYYLDPLETPQLKWLEADLAAVNRTKTPWVVVTGHRPTYCSADMTQQLKSGIPWERHNNDCLQSAPIIREQFEAIFYQYKVDLQLYGHVHSYERMNPVYNNQSQPAESIQPNEVQGASAPIVIISGMPGQGESYAPPSPTPLPWSTFQNSDKGYGVLTALDAETLLWQQLASGNQTIIDYLILRK